MGVSPPVLLIPAEQRYLKTAYNKIMFLDGTTPMTGDLDLDTHDIINAGSLNLAGDLDLGSNFITGLGGLKMSDHLGASNISFRSDTGAIVASINSLGIMTLVDLSCTDIGCAAVSCASLGATGTITCNALTSTTTIGTGNLVVDAIWASGVWDLDIHLRDNAGATKVSFKDSDGNKVGSIDSNGVASFSSIPTSSITNTGDITLHSDSNSSNVGDLIFKSGATELLRSNYNAPNWELKQAVTWDANGQNITGAALVSATTISGTSLTEGTITITLGDINMAGGDIDMATGSIHNVVSTAGTDAANVNYVYNSIVALDAQNAVIDKDLNTPPGAPAGGARYIVAAGGVGAWTGWDNDIAVWDGSTWTVAGTAVEGMRAWVEDENELYLYNGAAWVKFSTTADHSTLSSLWWSTAGHTFDTNLDLNSHAITAATGLTFNANSVIGTSAGYLQIIPVAGQYTRIGAGASAQGLADNTDLLVNGKLEVGDASFFSAIATHKNSVIIEDGHELYFGTGYDVAIEYNTVQTPDTLMLRVGNDSKNFLIANNADHNYDFQHALQTNPTIFIHSAHQATDEWLGITHNQTHGVITTGTGDLQLAPVGNINVKSNLLTNFAGATATAAGNITFKMGDNAGATTLKIVNTTDVSILECGTNAGSPLIVGAAELALIPNFVAHPVLSLTSLHTPNHDPQIKFCNGTGPTVIHFSMGLDSGDSKFKLFSGDGVGDTSEWVFDATGQFGVGADPLAKFHVTDGCILATGTTGATPVSGAGTRMMWIPAKGAFRAGEVNATQWDDANIGDTSVALGKNCIASGTGSFVCGWGCDSTAINTFAAGNSCVAGGNYSVALGEAARVSSTNSFGFGKGIINSNYSVLFALDATDYTLNQVNTMSIMGGYTGFNTVTPITTVDINGGIALNIVLKDVDDTPYTALITDHTLKCDCAAGVGSPANITVNLLDATSCTGLVLNIIKVDAGAHTVTIDGSGAQTINGALTKVISVQWDCYSLQSDGSNWIII